MKISDCKISIKKYQGFHLVFSHYMYRVRPSVQLVGLPPPQSAAVTCRIKMRWQTKFSFIRHTLLVVTVNKVVKIGVHLRKLSQNKAGVPHFCGPSCILLTKYKVWFCDGMSSVRLSVRSSVRLSVSLVDCDHIGWKSCKVIARTISPIHSLS